MSGGKKKPRSLIMCLTPLQMLIAEKIIEINSDQDFDLFVIALNDNEKYRNYFERVRRNCVNSFYYVTGTSFLSFLSFFSYVFMINKLKFNVEYSSFYLASIDSRHFQYFLSKNSKADIFTFDDGTANIIPSSLYHLNSKPGFFKRAVWRLFGIKCYMDDVKRKSLMHYTIYKDIPNIIANKKYLDLLPAADSRHEMPTKIIRIYLGQPLGDVSKEFDISFVSKNIKNLGVDFYYPHPREISYPDGDFEIIESSLIFEDFIVNFCEENLDTKIEVFSFISTALLNISSLDRVEVNYIYESGFYKLHHEFYKFAQESFGISSINLEEI